MPLPAFIPMSEKNAIASLGYWLQQNIVQPGEQFVNTTYEQAQGPFPVFAYTQRPLPDLGSKFFDDNMGNGGGYLGPLQFGSIHQFMVEFNLIAALTDSVRNAQQYVYQMRERLHYGLYWAGEFSGNTLVMPNIPLLNFDDKNSPHSITGGYLWWPCEEDNTWMESPLLVDNADPQKKRIQIMVRIRYTSIHP
ncbi:MAG: hypothetical protein KGL39_33860 [Patescibacteria group bacterium]|nr:hypothetical protein [Patescibacteria group bacterium]